MPWYEKDRRRHANGHETVKMLGVCETSLWSVIKMYLKGWRLMS